MRSIARTKRSGLKVVSTCTGCGGSCLGFKMAGFEVLWASEFVKAARDTYRANFPGVHIDERDIRQVTPESILELIQSVPRASLEGLAVAFWQAVAPRFCNPQ